VSIPPVARMKPEPVFSPPLMSPPTVTFPS
jgi:hypothetical protein